MWHSRSVASDNSIWKYCKYIFTNSVGQIEDPTYYFWDSVKFNSTDLYDEKDKKMATIMTISIWFVWIAFILFLFIVLCNFLIAYISQSYEDVLEDRVPNIYA